MSITRAIIMSDSHGYPKNLETVILKQPYADKYIFLGDGYDFFNETKDIEILLGKYPEFADKFVVVKGNIDEDNSIPVFQIVEMAGHRIFATHGHKYGVDFGYDKIIYEALREDCDIILHGHTHIKHTSIENGIYIMNPGSVSVSRDGSKASFGILDFLENGSIAMNISDVE
jgi:hypothetical protein